MTTEYLELPICRTQTLWFASSDKTLVIPVKQDPCWARWLPGHSNSRIPWLVSHHRLHNPGNTRLCSRTHIQLSLRPELPRSPMSSAPRMPEVTWRRPYPALEQRRTQSPSEAGLNRLRESQWNRISVDAKVSRRRRHTGSQRHEAATPASADHQHTRSRITARH